MLERRERGRVSYRIAQCRIGRTCGRILHRRRGLFGTIRASRPAPLLLELTRLPAQLLLLSGLVIVRFGHEVSCVIAGWEDTFRSGHGAGTGARTCLVRKLRPRPQ